VFRRKSRAAGCTSALIFSTTQTPHEHNNAIQTSFNSENPDRRIDVTLRDGHGLHGSRGIRAPKATDENARRFVQPAADSRAWTNCYLDSCREPLRNLSEHHHPIDFNSHRGGWSADQFRSRHASDRVRHDESSGTGRAAHLATGACCFPADHRHRWRSF
jgi:hypothetical protein